MGVSYKVVCDLCEKETEYALDEKVLMEQEMIIWKADMNYTISICPKCRKQLFQSDMEPLFDEFLYDLSQAMRIFYQQRMK